MSQTPLLTQMVNQLLADAHSSAQGKEPFVALEDRLDQKQTTRDASFADACFPTALLPGFVAGCWHYRTLSRRGSIVSIRPADEWDCFRRSQDVFNRAYRFTQVMAEHFRRQWLIMTADDKQGLAYAEVRIQRSGDTSQCGVHLDARRLDVVCPALLVNWLAPDNADWNHTTPWDENCKELISSTLRQARLDTYMRLCCSDCLRPSNNETSPAAFLNQFMQLGLLAGVPTPFPPNDPMKSGDYVQLYEPQLELLQSGVFWLSHLTKMRNDGSNLIGHLLLYPPGAGSDGDIAGVMPWCSVNFASAEHVCVNADFIRLHANAFAALSAYTYDVANQQGPPDLEMFARGADIPVRQLSDRLAHQKHEGQSLSFTVVLALDSIIDNGLGCDKRADKLAYYSSAEGPPTGSEKLDCCRDGTIQGPNGNKIIEIADALLGNYSFFQQTDAVVWILAEGPELQLHRAFIDRGFLFPGQLKTRHEIVQELCLRNPLAVVYECSAEGLYRTRFTQGQNSRVIREKWTGKDFIPAPEWTPREVVKKAFDCLQKDGATPTKGTVEQWIDIVDRVVEQLVDTRKGATFVLASGREEAERLSYPMTRVYFIERKGLLEIGGDDRAKNDLYHLAIEDGAVVLYSDGDDALILGRRFLMPTLLESDSKERYEPPKHPKDTKALRDGARHTSARLLSKSSESGLPVLCVSADGPISLYFRGTLVPPISMQSPGGHAR